MLISICFELLCRVFGTDIVTMLDMVCGYVPVDLTVPIWILCDVVIYVIAYTWWHMDEWIGVPTEFKRK